MGLSVFIITLNEQKYIQQCLESVDFADEIIVVDSGSTDQTESIVGMFEKAIFIKQAWLGYSKQKQFALDQCKNQWCLSLDADEWIDKRAKEFIEKTISKKSKIDGFYISRWDKFLDKYPPALMKKDTFLRFFKKESGFLKKVNVHEVIILKEDKVKGRMPGKLIHEGYNDPEVYKKKFDHYADLRAKASNKKLSILELIFIIPFETFRQLILKRKVFWGYRGIYLAALFIWYAVIKRLKLSKNGVRL